MSKAKKRGLRSREMGKEVAVRTHSLMTAVADDEYTILDTSSCRKRSAIHAGYTIADFLLPHRVYSL